MADNNTTATPDPAAPPVAPPDSTPPLPGLDGVPPDETDEPDDGDTEADKRLKTERRATRAANKRANDLQKTIDAQNVRIKKFEDANKSEEQKRAEELEAAKAKVTAAQADAAAARLELLRYQVGSEKQLSAALIPRLMGNTREELEADADRLAAEVAGNGAPPKPRRPQPDPRLGGAGHGQVTTTDQWVAALRNRI